MPLRVVKFADNTQLIVEAEEVDPDTLPAELGVRQWHGLLPAGAEPAAASDRMQEAGSLLMEQVNGLRTLSRALRDQDAPSHVEIQVNIKFTADARLIPFLVSTKGEGGLRLTLRWDRQEASRTET